jgi:S1-C subfamily serine protease
LFIGALFIEPHVVGLAHTQLTRSLLTLVSTLGTALILLSIGEYIGMVLKSRIQRLQINKVDVILGAVAGGMTLIITVWLVAPVLATLPFPVMQTAIRNSRIVSALDSDLPAAPNVIADLGRIIDPNGFPQVFIGLEPTPPANTTLPDLGSMQAAVSKDRNSVVKIEGKGCGGIVEGSGFVAANGLVITNAHVVAGVSNPYIIDNNGTHQATPIWFDPDLDLAVLSASDLAGKPLAIQTTRAAAGTPGVVLGYPGGGNLTAGPAKLLEEFNATGQNIYGQGNTTRDVYEVKATIIPGNSGGPIIAKDGSVIGVVFAESTTYNQIGYALATQAVANELHQAETQNTPVTTGTCAE